MLRPLLLAAAVAASLGTGCLGARRGDVCPGSRTTGCVTEEECAPDKERGCLVCTCKPWDGSPAREGRAATALPEGAGRPPPSPAQ
jgi:hypothetical protein